MKHLAKCPARRHKGIKIELGLAVSGATLPPGQYRDITEIAAFCECSKQLIHAIEKRAISKMRDALTQQLSATRSEAGGTSEALAGIGNDRGVGPVSARGIFRPVSGV